MKYQLLDRNTQPYYRYKPEPLPESANMILYWDRPIITDRTADFNGPDIVLISRENETDVAVPLPHNLPRTEAESYKI